MESTDINFIENGPVVFENIYDKQRIIHFCMHYDYILKMDFRELQNIILIVILILVRWTIVLDI